MWLEANTTPIPTKKLAAFLWHCFVSVGIPWIVPGVPSRSGQGLWKKILNVKNSKKNRESLFTFHLGMLHNSLQFDEFFDENFQFLILWLWDFLKKGFHPKLVGTPRTQLGLLVCAKIRPKSLFDPDTLFGTYPEASN